MNRPGAPHAALDRPPAVHGTMSRGGELVLAVAFLAGPSRAVESLS